MPTEWLVNGYVQGRFTQDSGEKNSFLGTPATRTDSFDVKRAYLQVHVKLDEHVGAMIMACANWNVPPYDVNGKGAVAPIFANDPSLTTQPLTGAAPGTHAKPYNTIAYTSNPDKPLILEAYAEYILNDFQAKAGMVRIPFGYEVPLSSAKLITTERSQIMQTQLYPFGFDRGVFAYYLPSKVFNASLAVTDGQPEDNNAVTVTEKKNTMGRFGVLIPGGQLGVSGYTGHNPIDPTCKFNFVGVDLEEKYGPFTLLSEGLRGSNGTTKPEGGYATLAFQRKNSASQPYVRYDIYTPDKTNYTGVYFHRITGGMNYFLNPTSKLQLEYQAIHD